MSVQLAAVTLSTIVELNISMSVCQYVIERSVAGKWLWQDMIYSPLGSIGTARHKRVILTVDALGTTNDIAHSVKVSYNAVLLARPIVAVLHGSVLPHTCTV